MSSLTAPAKKRVPLPEVELRETDGQPMDSDWHRLAMSLLIEAVTLHMGDRTDYFVGGNMFIYFNEDQARDLDFRGPDFFFVSETQLNPPRPFWAVWKEGGRYPSLIIELGSPTTIQEDRTTKKRIYETVFRTHEYFLYDPSAGTLEGWRLVNVRYEPIAPDKNGRLWCEELGLWLGVWEGEYQGKKDVYPRFFDAQGEVVPNFGEMSQTARKEAAKAKKEARDQRRRADALADEVAKLKSQIRKGPKRT